MKSKFQRLAIFGLTVFFVQLMVNTFVMQSFNVLQVKGIFPPGTQIFIRNSNGFHPILKKTSVGNNVANSTTTQAVNFQLSNRLLERVRVDIGHNGQPFSLEEISIHSHFLREPVTWNDRQLSERFEISEHKNQTVTSHQLKHAVRATNPFLQWLLPIVLGLFLTVCLWDTRWWKTAAIMDLRDQNAVRNANNLASLDGVRGMAALLVLLHHSTQTFKGYGGLGVWLFFVLSGFLLTRQFVLEPGLAVNPRNLQSFFSRRVKRIVPMYYFMITCIFLIQNHFDTAIRHYLFVQGEGHFWTILQEMYFYTILPLLTIACFVICRGRPIPSILFLSCLAVLWNHYGDSNVLSIYGLNQPLRAFFEVFLLGMIGAYWFYGIFSPSEKLRQLANRYSLILSAGGLLLLLGLLETSRIQNWSGIALVMNKEPLIGGILCLLLVILAVTGGTGNLVQRFFRLSWLRYIGIVGYSFYLIHPYAIFMTRAAFEHYFAVPYLNVSEIYRLIPELLLTVALASFTYSCIERPFIRKLTIR